MVSFTSQKEAESYRHQKLDSLARLQQEAESISGVAYSEVWLNEFTPSFIVGLNSEDEHFVSFDLKLILEID